LRITPTCHAGEAYARALRGAIGRTLTREAIAAEVDREFALDELRPYVALLGLTERSVGWEWCSFAG
jgi:hypothetical protein